MWKIHEILRFSIINVFLKFQLKSPCSTKCILNHIISFFFRYLDLTQYSELNLSSLLVTFIYIINMYNILLHAYLYNISTFGHTSAPVYLLVLSPTFWYIYFLMCLYIPKCKWVLLFFLGAQHCCCKLFIGLLKTVSAGFWICFGFV